MNPDRQPPKLPPAKPRGLLPFVLLFVGLLLFTVWLTNPGRRTETVSWSVFLEKVREGQVVQFKANSGFIEAEAAKSVEPRNFRVLYPTGSLRDADNAALKAAVAASPSEVVQDGTEPPSAWSGFFIQFGFIILLLLALWFFLFRRMGQGGGVLSFGKSRATLITKGKTGKTFKDVAGIDEAKDEVQELVEFLKHPKKFQKLGGRIPRGVLLVGPPGTGKTLLAKAIAGEADAPFYSISGSDFVEMFVGVGASRVRDLFTQAKENSPCIIFIDEIDAVARRRGSGASSGGHDEREQTLNAILVEMDGFSSGDKVIVIAATNRLDVLDPALIRPGRFDRNIMVNLPDIAGREQILQVHAGKVRLASDVNLSIIARGTPGFSGADLENLINEAALNAARLDKDAVYHQDLEYARDRVAFGRERKVGSHAMPPDERRITAYHEAGHAIIMALMTESDDLHKVSIIPRGRALGATMMLPKDRHTHSRRKLLGDIAQLFGGRIAEEKFCGDITTGASNDIERATAIARGMVYEWGMDDTMGPVKYTEQGEGVGGPTSYVAVSEQTRRELDERVRSILDQQYAVAESMIEEHRDALERIAEALLEHETLTAQQVFAIIDGQTLPARVPAATIPKPSDEASEPLADGRERPADGTQGLEPHLA
ncbi:MAG: ATP-dependent zinc metalloprotease FtsH [Planctomycetota bacterium]|nr:MAG: ATP-dependent zinc metalloprotease FtsH [Planctomycetota bacterium]